MVPESLAESLLFLCEMRNSLEKFASFLAVDHKSMGGVCANKRL